MNKTKDVLVNPALLFGVGLFPLIVSCADFKSALIYAVLLFLTAIFSQLLVSAFRLIIAQRVRFVCYTLVILSVVYFLDSAVCELFPKSYSSIHSLVVFLFASSIVFYSLEMASKKENFGAGFKYVLTTSASYCVLMVGVGFVREILSKGSIYGKSLSAEFTGLNFFSTAAGSLMIILVIALVYSIVACLLKKRVTIYNQLVERYGAVIKTSRDAKTEDGQKSVNSIEETGEETV